MKRKGFTLIELLAVIVILSVVALITISLVGNIIKTSKKGALTSSANGLIEAANLYYATKMIDEQETKTFVCSENGCFSGDDKLEYKGSVKEGRLTLYSDGKVSVCIEDGENASLKLAEQNTVTTEEGSCNYDGETYSIDEMISKTKYNQLLEEKSKLQEELTSEKTKSNEMQQEILEGKKLLSVSITNKGVNTFETNSFQEMANNINNIQNGILSEDVRKKLYSSLQYSNLVTENMSFEEMCAILAKIYPSKMNLFTLNHSNSNTSNYSLSRNNSNLVYTMISNSPYGSVVSGNATSEQFDVTSALHKLHIAGTASRKGGESSYYTYIKVVCSDGRTKTIHNLSSEVVNQSFDITVDLSDYIGKKAYVQFGNKTWINNALSIYNVKTYELIP